MRIPDPVVCAFLVENLFVGHAQVRQVKASLHVTGAAQGALPICRAAQVEQLQSLICSAVQMARGAAVYVSGLPGTGTLPLCSVNFRYM